MRVFLTGASSGIGRALAIEFHRRHPQLTLGLLARRHQALEALRLDLPRACIALYPVDVTDPRALRSAAAQFLQKHGVPDVVVANAGANSGVSTELAADRDRFAHIIATNVTAMFDTFGSFVAPMRARGSGRLVGIGSVAGIRGLAGSAAYCASKAAAMTYLESLRLELHGSGVRVVTVVPGYIRTPMTAVNEYPMPFLMDPQRFAVRTVDVIERGRSYAVVPWQMGWVAKGLRILPNAAYDALFARAPRKARLESL